MAGLKDWVKANSTYLRSHLQAYKAIECYKSLFIMSVPPAFSDISKTSNDASNLCGLRRMRSWCICSSWIKIFITLRLVIVAPRIFWWNMWSLRWFKAKIDVKSKAPNGVSFNVKGTSTHDGPTSASVSLQLQSGITLAFKASMILICWLY